MVYIFYSILFYFWSLHLLHPFISISSPSISHQNKLYCPFTLLSLIILYLPQHLHCLFIFLISSARYCFIIKQWLTIESMNIIMSPTKGEGDILFLVQILLASALALASASAWHFLVCTIWHEYYYVPHRRGGGHIVFGADPVGVGVSVSMTLSCLHDISWTGGWILTEFAWM